MASDKVVDWEVGSIDTNGNLALIGDINTFGAITADGPNALGTITCSSVTAALTAIFNGTVSMTGLPTSDPSIAGRLWSNSGVLTVSAG